MFHIKKFVTIEEINQKSLTNLAAELGLVLYLTQWNLERLCQFDITALLVSVTPSLSHLGCSVSQSLSSRHSSLNHEAVSRYPNLILKVQTMQVLVTTIKDIPLKFDFCLRPSAKDQGIT